MPVLGTDHPITPYADHIIYSLVFTSPIYVCFISGKQWRVEFQLLSIGDQVAYLFAKSYESDARNERWILGHVAQDAGVEV